MRVTRFVPVWPVLSVLVCSLSGVAAVSAHGTRAELAWWGGFNPETVRCQRAISRAAARCSQEAMRARAACVSAQLDGASCATASVDARLQAARVHAARTVEAACTATHLQNLRYLDLDDAINDVTSICRQMDTEATSAAYGPAMFGDGVTDVDELTRTCVEATAQVSAKLLRFATRARQRALDRIADKPMGPNAKQALLARATRQIERAGELLERRLGSACPPSIFQTVYGRPLAAHLMGVAQRADCLAGAVYVQDTVLCPAPVCGNGIHEAGEECDDGNDFDGDACLHTCTKANCETYGTTYDLIQRAIFENRGCTEQACHGAAQSGGLDLRADVSYDSLVDVPATTVPTYKRIDPGNKENSLLWINVAARTLPDQYHAPLRGMPNVGDPLSADEVEALRLWIEKGAASRTAAVEGTAELLAACLPEPKPAKIKPLPPPAPGTGLQLRMPAWTLAPKSESEVCYASYYDFSGQVPAELLTQGGTHFRYKQVDIRQAPLSHHLIINIHRGPEPPTHPAWGPYSCKDGPRAGESCDPYDLGFCGEAGDCATDPDPKATACIGFGPTGGFGALSGGFAFAQESSAQFRFPDGVYYEMPIKGVMLWNSHAFNLSRLAGRMEAWVNIYFPEVGQSRYRAAQIFNAGKIFWSDSFISLPLPSIPAFESREICNIHVFGAQEEPFFGSFVLPTQTVKLFELSGHMHERGRRFQIFRGAFTCKGGTRAGEACSPFQPEMCPSGTCTDNGGRDPQAALLYTNYLYNDPVIVRPEPPIAISGAAPMHDRALTYCAHYDNGAPPNIERVKRRSTSAPGATFFGVSVGGPCTASRTRCIGGPRHNQVCNGNHAFCDGSPGDGDCDACPLTGGFRTTDEMFILFGNYWLE